MKKIDFQKNIIFTLILAILLNFSSSLINISHAEPTIEVREWWAYKFEEIKSYEYFSGGDYTNLIGDVRKFHSILIPLRIPVKGNNKAKIDMVKSSSYPAAGITKKEAGELYLDGEKHDYSLPIKHEYRISYDNRKKMDTFPVWMIAEGSNETIPKERTKELLSLYREKKNTLQSLYNTIKRQGTPNKAGDYHSTHLFFLKSAMEEWDWVLVGGQKDEFRGNLNENQVETLISIMDEIPKYIESHRINKAEILEFKVDGYKGIINKDNKTIELYIPEGIVLNKENVEIETPDWVIADYKSGELKIGEEAKYTVQPIDIAYHNYKDMPKYDNLIEEWIVKVFKEDTANRLDVNSLKYISQYGEKIDAIVSENKIELNIPFYVDLDEIELDFYHTGNEAFVITKDNQKIKIEGNKIKNCSNIDKIKIKDGGVEKIYDFKVDSKKSANNEILDFRVEIDGVSYSANIDNEKNEIEIAVPFDTDISKLKTDIKIDYRATIKPGLYEEKDFSNPVIYTVTSESGDTRKYTAFIKRGEASSENEILSFRVGTIEGKIEGDSITVEVPFSVDLKNVKPFIEISPKAKIQPASSEGVDFSKGPIDYVVTAQNGDKRTYKVNIKHSQEEIVGPDEEYMAMLKKLRDNIYDKYKEESTSEDWEWMNIGFYEGKNNGNPNGIRKTAENLPEKFDMYNEIGELSAGKTTDFARFTMTLTAMGIDASNLEPFQIDGKPFRTDYGRPGGKEIVDMTEPLYNASGGGINGPIFALIALDMGEYSIPGTANLSRDDLVKILLSHEYGSDEFGIDMVAMLMQGLYPYQNHPVYGEEVKKKLDHGIELFLGSKSATKVEPLDKDFLGISWGAVNSESTAQVIIALCSMGIDPYSDYRFSRGPKDNMIVNWIDRFATKDLDGFGHTNKNYNFIGTYEGMYALQWYINFVENGGKPYSLYKDGVTFRFTKEFSKDAKINSFELLGKEGIIDHEAGIITIELPKETLDEELRDKAPLIEIPKGATISPIVGEKQDFTKDVEYTVIAEDGITTKKYKIKIERKEGIKSSKKDVLGGKIIGFSDAKFEIDNQKGIVNIELPIGTDEEKLKKLKVSFSHQGISISPDETEPQDFTKGAVVYTVTAEDGTTRKYKVSVNIKKEAPFWFTKFVLRGVEGKIDVKEQCIDLKLPFGTYLEEVSLNNAEFEPKDSTTSISPGLKELADFSKRKKVQINPYPLPPEGPIEYDLNIEYVSPSGNSKIEKFSVPGVETNIKGNTIELKLPKDIAEGDIKDLVPDIKVDAKTIDPDPKKSNNSLKDYYKDYVLTDEDGNVNLYTIKIIDSGGEDPTNGEDKNKNKEEMEIESFKIKGIEGEVDNNAGRIYIELPYELDLSNIYPIIEISKGSSIYPNLGQPLDLRYSNKFILSNGKETKVYTLIIRVLEPKPATKLWKYLEEYNETEDYQVVY
ncbi:DUF6242 domain-containing protein [Sporanaerobacter acetigenes]|uniref:DUF5018 domain-containing protein n=1 Tax=Sporanaerobacter acetigenes DSM 13106 TaxID=1123281 RepID=A0A1M5VHJ0_9FIRM|nr:DUF6242 domain-containing protein [Sporanaerobacter acetigenes]SHH74729.1 hypothetical protein SAMN02745180_00904 [Sporanaerobacter acetigenes DSM 13106]